MRLGVGLLSMGALFVIQAVLSAQQQPAAPQAQAEIQRSRGFYLSEVSLYGTYYSIGLPEYFGGMVTGANLSDDAAIGGRATMGYEKSGGRSGLVLSYTGGYSSRVRYSEWRGMYHSMSLYARRSLTPRWTGVFSIGGSMMTMEEFQFQSTRLGNAVSVTATADDLANGFLGRTGTNDPLSAALNGATLIESAAQNLFYGTRVLNSAAAASLSYARSSRLTISFGGGATRIQSLPDDRVNRSSGILIPQSTTANANVNVSYAITPRTQLLVDVEGARMMSRLQDTYTASGSIGVGRNMGQHWFLEAQAGGGRMYFDRHDYALPRQSQYLVRGSVGYRLYAHRFVVNGDRGIGDGYGFGAAATVTMDAAWRYARPGHSWALLASVARQELQGTQAYNTTSWRGLAGLTFNVRRSMALSLQYSHMRYSSFLRITLPDYAQHAVRVAVVWTPGPTVSR